MYFKYKCGKKVISVWLSGNKFASSVIIYDDHTKRDYSRSLISENDGRIFFTWNRHKIYLNDYIRTSISEINEKIKKGEWITSNDLGVAILSEGVDKVRFTIPLSFYDGESSKKEVFHIKEEFNRMIMDDYKYLLISEDGEKKLHLYTSDIVSFLRDGYVTVQSV